MGELLATKCSMCGTRDMVPTLKKEDGLITFMICPNCDNPNGKLPKNSYDGVGPKKNTT